MKLRSVLLVALFASTIASSAAAQPPGATPQPSAVTHTAYSRNTELFAEWRPLIVGQAVRLTAHLTRIGERFTPYAEGKVTLTLTIGSVTANAATEGPERPGVFRLNVTPTKAGTGRLVIDVAAATGPEHFVIDNVSVYADVQAALAKQAPAETGLVSYAKEQSWEADFATAPVKVYFPGAARIITVPSTAIVRDGAAAHVYVQRTPERFEFRAVKTRRTIEDAIEITSGLRDGERIVVRGAEKMPRE
ncbi:MAG: hypothetical protein HY047_03635 [Acidobacteria bacterium]|nr:hypothetical protein [Acidobacteriota bacterium]